IGHLKRKTEAFRKAEKFSACYKTPPLLFSFPTLFTHREFPALQVLPVFPKIPASRDNTFPQVWQRVNFPVKFLAPYHQTIVYATKQRWSFHRADSGHQSCLCISEILRVSALHICRRTNDHCLWKNFEKTFYTCRLPLRSFRVRCTQNHTVAAM